MTRPHPSPRGPSAAHASGAHPLLIASVACLLSACATRQGTPPAGQAWPGGHLTSVSKSYGPLDPSRTAAWPSNHDAAVSATWPASHDVAASGSWAPGHLAASSSTWPAPHDAIVSRVWWPGHVAADSHAPIWPPTHAADASAAWTHDIAISQRRWPPNHHSAASVGWGGSHATGVSVSFPPGHYFAASSTWTGPSPAWPPGHARASSLGWSQPADHDHAVSSRDAARAPVIPWPDFPADHDWFTSYARLLPGGWARRPWADAP